MNILLTGAGTPANVGDAAILDSTLVHLRRSFPGCRITVSSADAPFTRRTVHADTVVEDLFPLPRLGSLPRRVRWLAPNAALALAAAAASPSRRARGALAEAAALLLGHARKDTLKAYEQADLVLGAGGGYVNDNNTPYLPFQLFEWAYARWLGKPVYLVGQGIGPFRHPTSRFLSRVVLDRLQGIAVRDVRSVEELEALGVRHPWIEHTADAALIQPAVAPAEADALWRAERVDPEQRPLVGLAAIGWIFPGRADAAARLERYLEAMAALGDHVVESEAQLAFVSTNVGLGGNRLDDRNTADRVRERMRHGEEAAVVRGVYTPRQLKGLIGRLDRYVTSRMHASIFATTSGVPTAVVNYHAFKARSYLASLGLEHLVRDIEDVGGRDLIALYDRLVAEDAEVRQVLAQRLPELQGASRRSTDLVARDLEARTAEA